MTIAIIMLRMLMIKVDKDDEDDECDDDYDNGCNMLVITRVTAIVTAKSGGLLWF